MSQFLYVILFCAFAGIILALRLARSARGRRSVVTALVLYLIIVHAALVVMRRDAWPFATHGAFLESGDARRPFSNIRLVGVDAAGREYRIDQDSWSPIHDRTLDIWWLVSFPRLDREGQRGAMAFLLDKAEKARRTRASSRVLRFVAAPPWYSVEPPPPWSDAPYVGLRAYLVTRVPAQKLRDGCESSRLFAEFER